MAGDYDRKQIMDTICALLAEGQSLRKICAAVKGMPKHSTVLGWLLEDAELADQYARGLIMRADNGFDSLQDRASEIVAKYIAEGWEPKDAINMARLDIDTAKWTYARMHPRKYGDRITQEHTGEGGGPIEHVHRRELSDTELMAIASQGAIEEK